MGSRVSFPSEVTPDVGRFDRFAERSSALVSRGPFFAFCVLLVIVWMPSYFAFGSIDTWQLVINTLTTIVTFLLVALLQNSQTRSNQSTQHKLNAIALGLSHLMEDHDLDATELVSAVGLEQRESTT